jgi:NTE family protein
VRIGLVLAAGGSVGVAYHGAVLSALATETGWDPRQAELMIGTSAGSLTAALLRAGVPAPDLARISEGEPLSEEGARLAAAGRPHRPRPRPADLLAARPVGDWRAVVGGLTRPGSRSWRALVLAALPAGGIPTEAISEGIDALYQGGWPAAPLWVCAYDIRAGRRVVFGRAGAPPARVGQAVAASCAIPAYFRPVDIGGRRYVDGGAWSMVNLDLAAGAGLDLVVAVSPLSQAGTLTLSPAAWMRAPLRARLRAEVRALSDTGVPVVAVEPGRHVAAAMGLNPMNAARRQAVSQATREGVTRWLRDHQQGRHLARLLRAEAAGTGVVGPGASRAEGARSGAAGRGAAGGAGGRDLGAAGRA